MARRKTHRMREGRRHRGAAKQACAPTLQTRNASPVLSNYASNAGAGSQTFSTSDMWRRALLGTVAAGALFFGYGRSARAQVVPQAAPCDQISGGGTTVTCTGDVSAGISIDNPTIYSTLNVYNLTQDITAASGVEGIFFRNEDDNLSIDADDVNITTDGNAASGINAFIANGGGAAGDLDLTVTHTGDITTDGLVSSGIRARTANGLVVNVSVVQEGDILTQGNNSEGIIAENEDGTVYVKQTGTITTTGDGTSLGIYAGSSYGDITVKQYGVIRTDASGAHGIFATGGRSFGDPGGNTVITQVGEVHVEGQTADGIVGYAGFGGGDGFLEVTQTGTISATGSGAADGIRAYAFGGDITVTHTGDIEAGRDGILATTPNVASEGKFTVTLGKENTDLDGETVTGSTITAERGAGVRFVNGTDNTLKTYNTVLISGDIAQGAFDVLGGDGNETINNYGTLTTPGDIDLGTGDNAFNNMAGATFNSGNSVDLGGAGNKLLNEGDLSPGGVGTIEETFLTGDFEQTAAGTFTVDVDLGASMADSIDMGSSGTASMAGNVALNFFNVAPVPQSFTIVNDATVIPVQELGVLNPVVIADITYENGPTDVVLNIDGFDFSVAGLNQNQTNIGDHLNDAFDAGIGGLGGVMTGLANLTSLSGVANALDQLSPEIYLDTQIAALFSSLDFSSNLLSCRVNGTDTASINREGQCLWVGAKARFLDSDRTRENIGYDETAGLFAAGAQVALDPVWRLGFGVGYQKSSLDTRTGAESDGDQVQGGVALKYNPGALLLAGVVSGGRGWYDITRPMGFDGFAATASGVHEVDVLAGRLHASYVFGSPHFYYKPLIDAAVTRLDLDNVTETYADGAGLIVRGDDHTVFSVSPAVEVGTESWLSNGTLFRPFLRAGVTWFSDDEVSLSSSFAGTPDGVAPFTIRAEMDQVQADVAAGVEMINAEDSNLRLFYDGHFGDTIEIHSVGLKGSAKF